MMLHRQVAVPPILFCPSSVSWFAPRSRLRCRVLFCFRFATATGTSQLSSADPTRLAPSWTFTQPPISLSTLAGSYPAFALLTRLRERTCSLLQLSSRVDCSARALTCCFVRQPCFSPRQETGSREVPLILRLCVLRRSAQDERRIACLPSEAAGNRTLNPQLKRLLLCQLSYRPVLHRA